VGCLPHPRHTCPLEHARMLMCTHAQHSHRRARARHTAPTLMRSCLGASAKAATSPCRADAQPSSTCPACASAGRGGGTDGGISSDRDQRSARGWWHCRQGVQAGVHALSSLHAWGQGVEAAEQLAHLPEPELKRACACGGQSAGPLLSLPSQTPTLTPACQRLFVPRQQLY